MSAFQRLEDVDSGFAVRSLNGAVAPPSMGIAAPVTKRAFESRRLGCKRIPELLTVRLPR
jgi:hypothetical protein